MPALYPRSNRKPVLLSLLLMLVAGPKMVWAMEANSVRKAEHGTIHTDTLFLELENLGVEQGLSAGMIHTMAQDTMGYLWLGTRHGLNRYDGYSVQVFDAKGNAGLPDNVILSVRCTDDNLLWIQTEQGGCGVFDPLLEQWHPVSFTFDRYSFMDAGRNHWFHGIDSLWRVALHQDLPTQDRSTKQEDPWVNLKAVDANVVLRGLRLPKKARILRTGPDALWISAHDSIHRYRLDFQKRKAMLDWSMAAPWLDTMHATPTAWAHDSTKDKVYLLQRIGLMVFDANSGQLLENSAWPGENMPTELYHAMVDRQGRIWYAGDRCTGVYAPEYRTRSLLLDADPGFAEGELHHVQASYQVYEDRHQNLWFATNGYGAFQHPHARELFKYWGNRHKGPSIHRLRKSTSGEATFININTDCNVRFRGLEAPQTPFLPHEVIHQLQQSGLLHGDFQFDHRGHIWIIGKTKLTDLNLAWRFDSLGRVREHWSYSDPTVPVAQRTRFIGIHDGAYWTMLPLDHEDPMHREVVLYRSDTCLCREPAMFRWKAGNDGMGMRSMQAYQYAPDSSIWLGFRDGGLLHLNPAKGAWSHYEHTGINQNGLADNRVLSLLLDPLDPQRLLWVGTASGLQRYDQQTKTWQRFGKKDGLPDDVIYGILPDSHHQLWLSTNQGLCRFDPTTGRVRTFNAKDGLQHQEFNRMASVKDRHGVLFFGGVGGLTYFDPTRFYGQGPSSNLVINGVRLFNQDLFPGTSLSNSKTRVAKPIHALKYLDMHERDRMISVAFAKLNLSNPASNRYRYRLIGFQDEWLELGPVHEATFTNLSKGRYTFEVQSTTSSGTWGPATASLQFKVHPFWYNTTAFRLGAFVLLVFVGGIAFRYRQRQQEKVMEVRNRISRDLHDEIGSTLSSIALFGTVAQQELKGKKGIAPTMLGRIERNTQQVMESMSDIVWAVKTENDKIEHVVHRMRAFLTGLMETGSWTYDLENEKSLNATSLNMVQRRNLYLVFKEAVNNAVKYSDGTHIRVLLSRHQQHLILDVVDNGMGVAAARAKGHELGEEQESLAVETAKQRHAWSNSTMGGNGLNNMHQRAAEVGGTLHLSCPASGGTHVRLQIPLGRSWMRTDLPGNH